MGKGHKMNDYFRIAGGTENRTIGFVFIPQHGGVDNVSVVCYSDLAAGVFTHNRLGVADIGGTGRGIPHMPDGNGVIETFENTPPRTENSADLTHTGIAGNILAVTGGDARRLLPAMLKAVESKIGFLYCFGVVENSENPAFFTFFKHRTSDLERVKKTLIV